MNKPALLAGSMAPLPKGKEKRKNEPNDVYTEAQRKRAALLFGFLLLWREQAEAWSPRVCLVAEQHTWFGIVGLVTKCE
jgi:hypothetical protein